MNNRDYRKKIAEDTLDIIEKGYFLNSKDVKIIISEIQKQAEESTIVYTPQETDKLISESQLDRQSFKTKIEITTESTLDCVRRLIKEGEEDVICLNFASAKNPGGGFLGGSQAQEESLARSTGLYNCLIKANGYYETNRKSGTSFYTDYMIYTPKVPIIKNEDGENSEELTTCSIITAPAVNKGAVLKNEPKRTGEIESVMKRRIEKVLKICQKHKQETLVLGAWGCGVFQNNPEDIAGYFKEEIKTKFQKTFKRIVFAIYSNNDRFINAFKNEFPNSNIKE